MGLTSRLATDTHSDIGRWVLGTAQPERFVPIPAISQERTLTVPPLAALQLYLEKYEARDKMWKTRWSTERSGDQNQLLGCCRGRRVQGPPPWCALRILRWVPPSPPGSTDGRLSGFPAAEPQRCHLFPICCRSYLGGCVRQTGLPSGLRCLWWGSIWS